VLALLVPVRWDSTYQIESYPLSRALYPYPLLCWTAVQYAILLKGMHDSWSPARRGGGRLLSNLILIQV
jgi:hypothetical protein